jgi:hypothetical protein
VVTLAAALEACGVVGEIQISEGMAQILQDIFEVEERGVMNLPSIGPIKTFFLRKRKIEIRKVP